MIKKTPKHLQASDAAFEKVKDELEKHGIGIIKNKDFNQFEVYEIGNKFRGENYYSVDIKDRDLKLAFEAGLDMAKKLKRQNPKSKVSKKKIKKIAKKATKKVKKTKRIVKTGRPTYRRIAGENAAGGLGTGFGFAAGHSIGDWLFD